MFNKVRYIFQFLRGDSGSLQKRTVRSISWVGITGLLNNVLMVIRGIILARLLTPEIFGLMSICLVVIRSFEIFTDTGFYTALIQKINDYEEAKNTAFTLMILRGFFLAIVTVLLAPIIAEYYKQEILDSLLKVIALSFIFGGFNNVNMVNLQRDLNFKKLSYLEQSQGILNFAIVVILAYYFRSVWALVIGHVVSYLSGVILSFVVIPGRPKICINSKIARELFNYGKFITGVSVVVFITTEIDNLIVGKLLGMEMLGYYLIAYTLANLPATHISKVISRVLFPAYSVLQNNFPALREAFLKTFNVVTYITIPASAGLAVLAPEIIRVVYGDKWLPVVNSLVILCLFGCIRSMGALHGYLYNAVGKPHITFYLTSGKLTLILLIIYPMIKEYGLVGASLAVTIPMVIEHVVGLYVLRKVIGIEVIKILNIISVKLFYSGIMCFVVFSIKKMLQMVNGIELILLIMIGGFIYIAISRKELFLTIEQFRTAVR